MGTNDELVLIYTGNEIAVMKIHAELEKSGIGSIINDGFKQGMIAGFGGGVPSAIDIFVTSENAEKASEIVKAVSSD